MAISIEGNMAASIYFVERSPIIRMYQLSKLVTERGPIQFAVITSHRPENAMGKRDGFEWWTWLSFWAQKTQDLIQHCKSANMLFQKYADLRRSYVLFKPSWPLVKWSRHQCKSSVCRVFCTTNWIKVLFPAWDCLQKCECQWGNIGLLVA